MTTPNIVLQQPIGIATVSQSTPQSITASVPSIPGPPGIQGDPGPAGAAGAAGADGADGLIVAVTAGTAITVDNTIPSAPVVSVTASTFQPLAAVLTNTTASFTSAQETKLSGIATGAEVNVNADWNAASGDAQILNKPAIPSITGLLDETAHDALDHTGLTGIPAAYTLPVASASVLGGVKQGTGTSIDANGVISVTAVGTGDVVGPGVAVDSNFASFNTTTGKLIKDSGSKAADFATAAHNHTGVYAPVLGLDDNYVTDAEKAALHAAVTITDTASINLSLTGQALSADAIFGTSATTVAQGNHLHDSTYLSLLSGTENHVPSGFHDHTFTTLSMIENVGAVNDTFSVTITGTNFPVYIDGVRHVHSTETVTQVGALSKRYYIFYLTATGNLTVSDTSWNLESEAYDGSAPVCSVLWDAVNHHGLLEEERHHSWRDVHFHHWAHHSIGPRYSGYHHPNGLNLSNPGANNYATFSISAGEVYDEDISNQIATSTTCNLLYHHSNGTMKWEKGITTPYKLTAGVPQYDTGVALAGKNASNTTGYFVSWVYASNVIGTDTPIAIVVGQDTNNTMTLAEAQAVGLPNLPVDFVVEWLLCWKMIFRYGAGNALTHISNTDYRTAASLPSGQSPTANIAASAVTFAPAGNIAAVNVQTAIEELDTEKLATASFTDAAVTGKLITGFTSGAGTVAGTDTILQAINKLDGNVAGKQATDTDLTDLATKWTAASASGAASLQFHEDTDNGTNKVTVQAPATLAADYTLTLPVNDGDANQVLQTDGSGNTSWATPSAGGGLTISTKTSGFTAASGNVYQCDTSALSANMAVTLPTGAANAYFELWDFDGTWGTASKGVTVTPASGEKINGQAANETLVLNVSNTRVAFAYADATRGWQIDIGSSSLGANNSTVQALGTKDTNYTVDFNSGRFATATTGTGAATLTIPNWASANVSVKAWLYVTQGATARIQTLGAASGTNNNIISSGGLMSAGDALPNSGNSTVDAFEFTWSGTKWFVSNALYDVKS